MPPNTPEGLRHYRKYLSRKTRPFFCIYCGISVLPKEYEIHCTQHHDLNSKLCCVWCCGTESWRSGEKYRHIDHLIACFNQFYNSRQFLTPRPINWSPTCPEVESFFERPASIRQLISPRAFQSVWPPEDLPTPPITFQNENLNLAASYLQLYLETRNTHDWLHVMVKAIAMESFLQALDHDDGGTRVLEFWCWCDGGRDREDLLRQHRHMIVLSEGPRGRFKQAVWSRVRVHPSPRRNFPSKRFKKIDSPRHLVNTLGYLSKRQSNCNFTSTPDAGPPNNNHFYIFKTLPKGYKLPLCTLWPGGLLELLEQEKFQNVSILEMIKHPLFQTARNQWRQKIKHFYKLERGLVIPVQKRFEPTLETTPHFLHLTQTQKLHFRPNPANETLNQAEWLQMQFEGGNSFYDAVGEEIWIPLPGYQTRLNEIMSFVKKNEDLESKNEEISEENEELKMENEELKRKFEEEREKHLELSYKLNNVFEKRISELETENTQFRKRILDLETENTQSRKRICDLETENTQSRKRICDLETENAKLKRLVEHCSCQQN